MKLIASLVSAHLARGQQRANLRVLLGLVGALAVIVTVFSGIFHLLMVQEGQEHSWVYRGQILPGDEKVTVQASITEVDDETRCLKADGFLSVDGRIIYQMGDFALRMTTS